MGRRKIEIEPITDERNRTVTFVKRKAGLFKKAHELSILCQVDVLVIIVGHNHKVYEYSSVDTGELMQKYNELPKIQEIKQPSDYGDYAKESRIAENPRKRKGNGAVLRGSRVGGDSGPRISLTRRMIKQEEDDEDDDEDDAEDDEEEVDDDDEEEEDEDEDPRRKLKREHPDQDTPSKPGKKRKSGPGSKKDHQSMVQSSFQHQRAMMQQQQGSPLPPVSTFSPSTKYFYPQQHPQNPQPQQLPQQYYAYQTYRPGSTHMQQPPHQLGTPYAASPLYSSTSSNSGHAGTGAGPGPAPATRSSSHRPVLRVQIPSATSEEPNTNNDSTSNNDPNNNNNSTNQDDHGKLGGDGLLHPGMGLQLKDSAMTLSAIDSSKNDGDQDNNSDQNAGNNNTNAGNVSKFGSFKNGPGNKRILPGINTSLGGQSLPPLPQSGGSNSPKSTPISLTLPNGLFILPQPQPSPSGSHTIFPSPFNSGLNQNSQGNTSNPSVGKYMQQQVAFNGETPLSLLPSKYLNNDLLFLSPSNFYSNEWNIPFGSTQTPTVLNRHGMVQNGNTSGDNPGPSGLGINASTGQTGGSNTGGGTLSAIIRDSNSNIMLPSPSQMMGNVFNSINGGAAANNSTGSSGAPHLRRR